MSSKEVLEGLRRDAAYDSPVPGACKVGRIVIGYEAMRVKPGAARTLTAIVRSEDSQDVSTCGSADCTGCAYLAKYREPDAEGFVLLRNITNEAYDSAKEKTEERRQYLARLLDQKKEGI